MPTLLELTSEMLALDERLDETGGEITPDIVEMIQPEIGPDLAARWEAKIVAVQQYRQDCKLRAQALEEESNRVGAIAAGLKRRAEWLDAMTLAAMEQLGYKPTEKDENGKVIPAKKVERNGHTVNLQYNGGSLAVEIVDPAAVPDEFIRFTPEIDKKKIAEHLAAMPAGVVLSWARLGERSKRVVYK